MKKIAGRSKGTTRILGETVSKSFKIAGMTKETKNVKLLGVTYWNKRMFAPVSMHINILIDFTCSKR